MMLVRRDLIADEFFSLRRSRSNGIPHTLKSGLRVFGKSS